LPTKIDLQVKVTVNNDVTWLNYFLGAKGWRGQLSVCPWFDDYFLWQVEHDFPLGTLRSTWHGQQNFL